jgi:succinate dehydrogenase / fumarate reductase, membrane anchor subunit
MSDAAQALSRVLGRGSAHEGAHHWRVQRLTALALLLLAPWFLISLLQLPDLTYSTLHAWAESLTHATLLALLVICLCWHSQLGVQVVIEDYVKGWLRMAALIVSSFLHVLVGAIGVIAIVRIALGSTPGV